MTHSATLATGERGTWLKSDRKIVPCVATRGQTAALGE